MPPSRSAGSKTVMVASRDRRTRCGRRLPARDTAPHNAIRCASFPDRPVPPSGSHSECPGPPDRSTARDRSRAAHVTEVEDVARGPASMASRPSSTTARAAFSTTGQPASSVTGSRLPCRASRGRRGSRRRPARCASPPPRRPGPRGADRLGHRAEQFGGAHPTVGHRHAVTGQRGEHPGAVRQHVGAVVGQRQRARQE